MVSANEDGFIPKFFKKKEKAVEYCATVDLHSFFEKKHMYSFDVICLWIINKNEKGYSLERMEWADVLKSGHGCLCKECRGNSH